MNIRKALVVLILGGTLAWAGLNAASAAPWRPAASEGRGQPTAAREHGPDEDKGKEHQAKQPPANRGNEKAASAQGSASTEKHRGEADDRRSIMGLIHGKDQEHRGRGNSGKGAARNNEDDEEEDGGDDEETGEIEFAGVIESLTATEATVSGMVVVMTTQTEVEGTLSVGARVKVEGTLQNDGSVLAEEIEVQRPRATPIPLPPPSGTPTPGQSLYDAQCASCHGAGGIGGSGPALNTSEFARQFRSDAQIVKVVRRGDDDMPAFSQSVLSDADLAAIVGYIRLLRNPQPTPTPTALPTATPAPPSPPPPPRPPATPTPIAPTPTP